MKLSTWLSALTILGVAAALSCGGRDEESARSAPGASGRDAFIEFCFGSCSAGCASCRSEWRERPRTGCAADVETEVVCPYRPSCAEEYACGPGCGTFCRGYEGRALSACLGTCQANCDLLAAAGAPETQELPGERTVLRETCDGCTGQCTQTNGAPL